MSLSLDGAHVRALLCSALALLALAAAPRVHADEADDLAEAVGWEFAPFYGYRFEGDIDDPNQNVNPQGGTLRVDLDSAPCWGAVLEFPSGHHTQWQIWYSRQSTNADIIGGTPANQSIDLDIEYLHFGGTYVMAGDKDRPYVGFTFGATRINPEGNYDDDVEFSMALIGGVKFRVTRHVGVRFDVRAIGTVTGSNQEFFCNGGCVAHWSASGMWQYEGTVGLNIYL